MKNLDCTYARKLVSQRNIEVASLPEKTFTQAAALNKKVVLVDMKILKELQKEVKIKGSMTIVEMLEEDIEKERKRTIISRTYNNKAHKNKLDLRKNN